MKKMLLIILATGEFVGSNFLHDKYQMIIGGAFFIALLVYSFYWENKDRKKNLRESAILQYNATIEKFMFNGYSQSGENPDYWKVAFYNSFKEEYKKAIDDIFKQNGIIK